MPRPKVSNFFSGLPSAKNEEAFRVLAKGRYFRIERIVSRGQATPKNKWLREKTAEWVMVLGGRARLSFRGARKALELKAGDYVFIPKNTDHRVDRTHPRQKTLWLAILFSFPARISRKPRRRKGRQKA